MKRLLILSLCMLAGMAPLASFSLDYASPTSWAMAESGLALGVSPDSYKANPALLAVTESDERSFLASLQYQDQIQFSNFSQGEVNPLLVHPTSGWMLSFSAGNLAFSIENRNTLSERTQFVASTQYEGTRTTLFQFDWATRRSVLAFGVSAKAIAQSTRSLITIREQQTILDYLVETTVGTYSADDDSSNVAFGWGLLLDYDWFKMGVVSDRFAYASADDALVISIDSLLKSLDWGISLSSPTYDETNQLHLFKFETALDLLNLGSDEERELRYGLSVKLQLLPTWAVHLLVGYRESKPTPTDIVKIDMNRGFQTIGLIGQFDAIRVKLGYGFPTAWYRGNASNYNPMFLFSLVLAL